MSTTEKAPQKAIGIRISEEKFWLYKQALNSQKKTMQQSMERYVDQYIEKFGPKP